MLPSTQPHQCFPLADFYRNPRAVMAANERNARDHHQWREHPAAEFEQESTRLVKRTEPSRAVPVPAEGEFTGCQRCAMVNSRNALRYGGLTTGRVRRQSVGAAKLQGCEAGRLIGIDRLEHRTRYFSG
jgi:hypothetical protein